MDEVKVKRGKKSRAQGGAFETRVRADLEKEGWTVDKWSNNVELPRDRILMDVVPMTKKLKDGTWTKAAPRFPALVKAKAKWAGPGRPMMMGAGFPDFIAFRPMACSLCYARMGNISTENHRIIGVESKMNGELDREEKEKCVWLLENKIFSKILIASKHKIKNRVHIEYEDFTVKYHRFLKSKD